MSQKRIDTYFQRGDSTGTKKQRQESNIEIPEEASPPAGPLRPQQQRSEPSLHESSTIPICWTTDTWETYKTKHPWLFVCARKLGCSVCKEVKTLGVTKMQGVRMADEWISGRDIVT